MRVPVEPADHRTVIVREERGGLGTDLFAGAERGTQGRGLTGVAVGDE